MRTQIKATLAALSCLWLSSCQSPGRLSHQQLGSVDKLETVRFFYPSAGGNIEAYVVRPDGEGPFPLVILLHGHSFIGRGAEQVLATAQTFARDICFAGLAISLPGYGASEAVQGSVEDTTRRGF